jgi:hypothetical protein
VRPLSAAAACGSLLSRVYMIAELAKLSCRFG